MKTPINNKMISSIVANRMFNEIEYTNAILERFLKKQNSETARQLACDIAKQNLGNVEDATFLMNLRNPGGEDVERVKKLAERSMELFEAVHDV